MPKRMVNLPTTHPGAHQALLAGEFGAQRSTKPFAQVAVDQTIEQTMNRHSKTRKGGTVGFSKKQSATQRWQLTVHDRAQITSQCHNLASLGDEAEVRHKDQNPQRIQRDEQDVQVLMNTLTDWVNPFSDDSTHLNSLSSGCVAPPDVQSELEQAHCKGAAAFVAFVEDRLVKNKAKFLDPITKMQLKTFRSVSVKKKVRAGHKLIQIKVDKGTVCVLNDHRPGSIHGHEGSLVLFPGTSVMVTSNGSACHD